MRSRRMRLNGKDHPVTEDKANHRAAYLTLGVFLAGFGGMIWAIASAISLF